MSSEEAEIPSNDSAKSKGLLKWREISDDESDSGSLSDDEQEEPGPNLQLTGASSSCTQAQEDDSEDKRVPRVAESKSESAKEKHNHGEIPYNGCDNEADSSGPADEAGDGKVGNNAAERETPGPSNIAKMAEGPQDQRELPKLVKNAKSMLKIITQYMSDKYRKPDPPLVIKVDFFETHNGQRGTRLELNDEPVSKENIRHGPGQIWSSIKALVSGMNVDEDTRIEALNEVLAADDWKFKIENFRECEGREGHLIASFEIHSTDQASYRKRHLLDTKHAQNESNENEGEASDCEDAEHTALDDEVSDEASDSDDGASNDEDSDDAKDRNSRRRSTRLQKQTSISHNNERCRSSKRKQEADEDADDQDADDQGSDDRDTDDGNTDDEDSNDANDQDAPLRSTHLQKRTSINHNNEHCRGSKLNRGTGADVDDAKDRNSRRRSARLQKQTSINHNTEHCRGSKRNRGTDADRDDAKDRNLHRRSARLQKQTSINHNNEHCRGSKRKQKADEDSNEDQDSLRRSSRRQTKTSINHNNEHCHGSQHKRKTDAGIGTLSKKAQTQFVNSSSCSVENSASTSRNGSDCPNISNQSNSNGESNSCSMGSNASNSNQRDTTAINTTTSDTPSIEAAQNNTANGDTDRRRFKMLYKSFPKDVKLQSSKEMLREAKHEDVVRKILQVLIDDEDREYVMSQLIKELFVEIGGEDIVEKILRLLNEMDFDDKKRFEHKLIMNAFMDYRNTICTN